MSFRWYLAGEAARSDDLNDKADDLANIGEEVIARWLGGEELDQDAEGIRRIEDISKVDGIILFAEVNHKTRKSYERHVEFGLALGLNKRLVVIGDPESVFQSLPVVERYPTWQHFLDEITREIQEDR